MTTIEATHGAVSVKQQGMRLVQQAISDEHRRLHALLRGKTALLNLTASRSHTAARQIRTISQETSSLRDLMAAQLEGKESLLRGDTPRRREAMSVTQNACRQYKPIIAEKTKNNNLYMENSQEKHLKVNLSCGTFSQARGNLPMPTRGRVTTLYGQINDVGLASRGIVISAHSGAQVFASYDGIVVFSGLLRGYGPLLIIEHGEGYHMVLSGMARIDAEMGQHLLVGEPVGVIANIIKPLLYVELRREGHPINPMPWLVACEGGVKG